MDLFIYNPNTVLSFILTLMRVSIIMFMLPIFSTNNIPVLVKAGVTLIFTLAVWPHVTMQDVVMPQHPFDLALLMLGDIFIGLVLGMTINFLFMGIQSGGELLGFQMGFTMIQFADPLSGNQTGMAAFFLWMVSILTFFALDGHLYMIKGFAESFRIIPMGALYIGSAVLTDILRLSADMIVLAIKIAAPVMIAIFMVEVALGLIARTSPQVHIMEFGFPIKIGVGFFFIGLMLIVMSRQVEGFIAGMDTMMANVLRSMSSLFQ